MKASLISVMLTGGLFLLILVFARILNFFIQRRSTKKESNYNIHTNDRIR